MVGWYWGLHSWNRISLASSVAALATMAVLDTFTTERVIVLPFVAAFMWACGWAAVSAWRLVRKPLGVRIFAQRSVAPRAFT